MDFVFFHFQTQFFLHERHLFLAFIQGWMNLVEHCVSGTWVFRSSRRAFWIWNQVSSTDLLGESSSSNILVKPWTSDFSLFRLALAHTCTVHAGIFTLALTRLKSVWNENAFFSVQKYYWYAPLSHPSSYMLVNQGPSQQSCKAMEMRCYCKRKQAIDW